MDAFSIRFHSIDYSEASGLKIDNIKIVASSENSNQSIVGREGIEILNIINNTIDKDRRSRYNIKSFISDVNGSIFGFCIPEGYIMLKCSVSGNYSDFNLKGFFLHRSESLRTAWKLTRWQLLYLCALGWEYTEVAEISLEEIDHRVNESMTALSDEYKKNLSDTLKKLMTMEIPDNFALASYNTLAKMPLDFRSSAVSLSTGGNADSQNGILLNSDRVNIHRRNILSREKKAPVISGERLVQLTHKEYLHCVKQMYANTPVAKEKKKEAEEQLEIYNCSKIWCIRFSCEGKDYYELVDRYSYDQLLRKRFHYSGVKKNCDKAYTRARAYFDYLKKCETKQECQKEKKKAPKSAENCQQKCSSNYMQQPVINNISINDGKVTQSTSECGNKPNKKEDSGFFSFFHKKKSDK